MTLVMALELLSAHTMNIWWSSVYIHIYFSLNRPYSANSVIESTGPSFCLSVFFKDFPLSLPPSHMENWKLINLVTRKIGNSPIPKKSCGPHPHNFFLATFFFTLTLKIVLVRLSTSVERVGVFRMQNFLCLFVPFIRNQKGMDWRLLVKEHLAKISKVGNQYFFGRFQGYFLGLKLC